jgi:hypothetical protein
MRSRILFPRSFARGRGSVGRIEPAWFAADTCGHGQDGEAVMLGPDGLSRFEKLRCLRGCTGRNPLQTCRPPLLNRGIADTLEEAKAALALRYQQMKCGE